MKRKLLLAALLLSGVSLAQSPDLDIKWGELYKTRPNQTLTEVFGYDETGYYTYQASPNIMSTDPFVEKYDNNFTKTGSALWTAKKSPNKDHKGRIIEGFVMIDGKVVAISSKFWRKEVQRRMYFETLDNQSMQTKNDTREFAAYDMDAKMGGKHVPVQMIKSQDESKMAFFTEIPRKIFGIDKSQMFAVNVVNADLSNVWQHTLNLPYNQALFSIKEMVVTNGGDFYLLGFERFAIGRPWGKFRIIHISASGDVQDYPMSLPTSRYITSTHIEESKAGGSLLVFGMYSDKITGYTPSAFGSSTARMYDVKGVFKAEFKNGGIDQYDKHDFSNNYIVSANTRQERQRTALKFLFGTSGETTSYQINKIMYDESNNMYMFAEQYLKLKKESNNLVGPSTTNYYYYYQDVMVIKFDPSGNMVWTKTLEKGQQSMDDGGYYSSFTARVKDGEVYVMYNDNIKNYEGKRKDVMTYGSGVTRKSPGSVGIEEPNPMLSTSRGNIVVSLWKIDKDGNTSKTKMFEAKENGAILVPKISNDRLDKWIIYSKRNRNERLGEVVFK